MSYSRRLSLSTQPARVIDVVNVYVSGWSQMYNKATVMSTMMAALSCLFFAYVQEKLRITYIDRSSSSSTTLLDTLSTVSYLAVLCNCYAAVMAVLNADRMSQAPLNIAQRAADEPDASEIRGHILSIIMYHVKVPFWSLFRAYWACYFVAGYLSVCAELVLYAWTFTGRISIQIFASTFTGVALLPLVLFWLG